MDSICWQRVTSKLTRLSPSLSANKWTKISSRLAGPGLDVLVSPELLLLLVNKLFVRCCDAKSELLPRSLWSRVLYLVRRFGVSPGSWGIWVSINFNGNSGLEIQQLLIDSTCWPRATRKLTGSLLMAADKWTSGQQPSGWTWTSMIS